MANQEVRFGDQPPKDAEVQFGKIAEADETTTSTPGESDPGLVGVVPVYAGGDAVPETAYAAEGAEDTGDAPDVAEDPSEGASEDDANPEPDANADDDTEAGK